MVTFQYCDEGKQVKDSRILFPGIAKFEKVKQTTDRVYLLEIQPEPSRLFFWMQEEDREGDADRCKKLHNAINGITEPVGEVNQAQAAQDGGSAVGGTAVPPRQPAAQSRPAMAQSGF